MPIYIHTYGGSTNALSCRSYPFASPVTSAFFFPPAQKKQSKGLKSGSSANATRKKRAKRTKYGALVAPK